MNSNIAQRIHQACRGVRLKPLQQRRAFRLHWVLLLALGIFSARGDFSDPYVLTPPDPGNYLVIAPASRSFGNWTCTPTARALRVDTSLAPGSVTLDTEPVNRSSGGFLYVRAQTSGVVTFDYTITGQGTGRFEWHNMGPNFVPLTPVGSDSELVSTQRTGSITVQAGDLFGFGAFATGVLGGETGRRIVTITNFVMQASPTMSINDIVVAEGTNGTYEAVFKVWMLPASTQTVTVAYATADGSAVDGSDYVATNNTLSFAPGETNKTIVVTVTADAPTEADEDFFVNLTNVVNAAILKAQGRAIITEVAVEGISVDVAVKFKTGSNHHYLVERSDDLIVWSPLPGAEDVPGTGATVTVYDPGVGCNSQRHYRVRLRE
jgi:hypothetical protein